MTNLRSRCMVIGIGNPDRGDDAAGIAVARLLRNGVTAVPGLDCEPAGPSPTIIEHDGEAAALILEFTAAERLFVIDACISGAPPGTVHRFDVSTAPMPALASGWSTHGLGLAAAVELARALGRLPLLSVVYAIEGRSFATGAPLTPPVARAAAEVVRLLGAEIEGSGDLPRTGDCREVPHHG
ncbi:MAG: hydrogenase maturation protease [Bradyrhizobiaceae bacterium]|nr:hydrogenase maturation protease [Bradyrhizobiaceae bacterium]